jgi:hypothetical protein
MSTIQPQAYILIEKIIGGDEICIFKKYFCNILNLDIHVINLYTIWKRVQSYVLALKKYQVVVKF